jgi:hypothetical protein
MKRYKVTVTTAADGSATAYTPRLSGLLHAIEYVKPGSGSYDDGVDFTITDEATGKTLWTESNVNASKVCLPRAATHTTAGVAATLDGTVAALDKLPLANTRVKIVLAQGGNAKVGAFQVLVD